MGTARAKRFERDGASEDLDAAIDLIKAAVDTTGSLEDRAGYSTNLGNQYMRRFEYTS